MLGLMEVPKLEVQGPTQSKRENSKRRKPKDADGARLLSTQTPTKLRIVKAKAKGHGLKQKSNLLVVPGPNDSSLRYKIHLPENSSGGRDTEEEEEQPMHQDLIANYMNPGAHSIDEMMSD